MTYAFLKKLSTGSGRSNKYGNRKVEYDGLWFDSGAERDRYIALLALQNTGQISCLRTQVRIPLSVNEVKVCSYVADFTYYSMGLERVVMEDYKGFRTPVFNLKARLFKAITGEDIILQDGLPATKRRLRKKKR